MPANRIYEAPLRYGNDKSQRWRNPTLNRKGLNGRSLELSASAPRMICIAEMQINVNCPSALAKRRSHRAEHVAFPMGNDPWLEVHESHRWGLWR